MCGTPEKDAQDTFSGKNESPRREIRLMFRNGIVIAILTACAYADNDLVLHYTFEGNDSPVVRDHSGYGHHGTIHGGAQSVTDRFGTALKFDGIDDHIRCEPAPGLDTSGPFTVEAWVLAERSAGGIFSRHTGGSWADQRLVLAMYERDGEQRTVAAIADGNSSLKARPPPLPLSRWVHLAASFDGKYIRIYHDGELQHTNHAAQPFLPLVRDVPIFIGRSEGIGSQPFFKGLIGEVRCYRRCLSSQEIANHWAGGWNKLREFMIAKRMDTAPVVDGRLDDPAWQAAAAADVPGLPPPPQGTSPQVRVGYDDLNLYVAFTCAEADPARLDELASGKSERASNIWSSDVVEVFLDPDRTRQRYYHLAASPMGGMSYDDQTGFGGGATQDPTWHEPWTVASHVDRDAGQWTLELAVPFTSLTVETPKPGDAWLANFGRERPSGQGDGQSLYLWSQLSSRFNDPTTFGALCFDRATAQVADLINPAATTRVGKGWKDPSVQTVGYRDDGSVIVPTAQTLRPAGRSITFPGRPIDMALSPDGRWLVVTTSHEIILIHVEQGLKHTLPLPEGRANSLHGILFTPDSRTVFVAGHHGQVEKLRIADGGKLELDEPRKPWNSALCGMSFSLDGRYAYAAASPSNRLLVLSSELDTEVTSVPTGVAPYSVVHGPGNKLYVSNWGGRHATEGEPSARTDGARVLIDPKTSVPISGTVTVVQGQGRSLDAIKSIDVGRFPCQLLLSPDRSRLYVPDANDDTITVIDTATDTVINTIPVRPDDRLPYGSQPVALTCSPDGETLYVANATNNAIAVIKDQRLAGMIPVGWFPGAIQANKDGTKLFVANVRGLGGEAEPVRSGRHVGDFLGLVSIIDVPDEAQLADYTRQVAENNRQMTALMRQRQRKPADKLVPVPANDGESSVFEHVIYIIRENHTYDQDLGDMPEGNGEPRLCSAGEKLTPNAHALARQFVLLDNYHLPSVQSPTGHQWISQAITNSYWEKAFDGWPRYYSYNLRDALAFAPSGFIWDNVLRHGLTFRNYGEGVSWDVKWADPKRQGDISFIDVWKDFKTGGSELEVTATPNIASLQPYTHPHFPGYGYLYTDVQRAKIFIDDLKKYEREGTMPNLVWIFLPNNHTSGSRPGFPSSSAQIADNDMALGQIVDAVSHSRFWSKTVIFCTEDDPWNGTDHVAGSRSLCYIASPYTKRGQVISNLYTLTGLVKTIEMIHGLPMMNQLDLLATPMTDCFTDIPDLTPYVHIKSKIPLDELNPKLSQLDGPARFWAEKSMAMPLMEEPDEFPEQLEVFKRLAWYAIVGVDVPFPYIDDTGRILHEDPLKFVK